nr:plasmid stabilisation system protein [uncultured bacterium]
MKIIWSDEATAELWEILMMVAEYAGLASSERYQSEFERLVALAADNPRMGSIGIIPKTRELYPINGKYRIVYEITGDVLHVLTVKSSKRLHTAQTLVHRLEKND